MLLLFKLESMGGQPPPPLYAPQEFAGRSSSREAAAAGQDNHSVKRL